LQKNYSILSKVTRTF
jgi:hypothetical protein